MRRHINYYFETSAVNYIYELFQRQKEFGSLATRKLQNSKGIYWKLSSITLWELFQIKNKEKRYEIFDLARCLFDQSLISSPEEIIINYVNSGSPNVESHYDLVASGSFAIEWQLACNNLGYYFEPDSEQAQMLTEHLRFIGEYFIKTNRGYSLKTYKEIDEISDRLHGAHLRYIYNELIKLHGGKLNEEQYTYIAAVMQVVMLVFCFGIGIDQHLIENFWKQNGSAQMSDRLEIAVRKFPDIFFRGPLALITRMIITQSNGKTSRGVFFDSLHSIYITYSDVFITNDDHFNLYRQNNLSDPNVKKIMPITNMEFFIASQRIKKY